MPDPITIHVSLDLNATPPNPKITVDTPTLEVPFGQSPTIQWVLGTVPENTALAFIDNWHPHNPLDPAPTAGNDFTGTDDNNNSTQADQVFTYDIFLLHNCAPVPKDPEIVNQTGGGTGAGAFKLVHPKSQ